MRIFLFIILCIFAYANDDSEVIIHDPLPFRESLDIYTGDATKSVPSDDKAKLERLQRLRYEVFSLKQQLGSLAQESVPFADYKDSLSAKKFNAIAQIYSDAMDKSGFFVGFGIGAINLYTSGYRCAIASSTCSSDNASMVMTHINVPIYSANGGYQRFFNYYIGARIYGGLQTTFFTDVYSYNINNGELALIANPNGAGGNLQSFYALATLSADMLFEFPLSDSFRHYVGGFFGMNIGIMYYRTYATSATKGSYYPTNYLYDYNLLVDYSFNLGASLTLFNIHRIELALVIPASYLELPGFTQAGSDTPSDSTPSFWRSAIFSVNYKLILNFGSRKKDNIL